jgi:hypothetical protein
MSRVKRCTGCGFLSLGDVEFIPAQRRYVESGGDVPRQPRTVADRAKIDVFNRLDCWRHQWPNGAGHRDTYSAIEMLGLAMDVDRSTCEYFERYEPGLSPRDHADTVHRRKSDKRSMIYGGIAGLVVSVISELLRRLF